MRTPKNQVFGRYLGTVMVSLVLLAIVQGIFPMPQVAARGRLVRQLEALRVPYRYRIFGMSQAPHYDIDARVDLQAAVVDGQLRLRYINTTGESLSALVFRLLPNAQTIYGGGSLSVETVSHGSVELDYELSEDRTSMRVPLPKRLAPERAIKLDIGFRTELPVEDVQGYGILAQTSRLTSLAGWYPILAPYRDGWYTPDIPQVGDGLVADTSFYEVTLQVPAEVEVVSTGAVRRVERKGEASDWHLVSGPVREFAVAISEDFELYQAQVEGVTVRFHALRTAPARTPPDVALEKSYAVFQVFQERFGPYPFTELDVVEAPVSIGGYEFSGMVYVDDRLRLGGDPDDYTYIVAHEVAHQWWYGLVGNDSINEPWLDESLASYSAALYLEQAEGEAARDALLGYWRRTYGQPTAQDPAVNSSASRFSSWLTYRSPVYYQGALFLHALRREIGDAAFFSMLSRYLSRYRFQTATTGDLLGLAEAVACRDLDPLFERWFEIEATAITTIPCVLSTSEEPGANPPR